MNAKPDLRVLSLGGGTQSCALALMAAAGLTDPLDAIIFADTQGELPETYAYIDYLRGVVETAGIPLYVVTAGNLYDDYISEAKQGSSTPPLHLITESGKGRVSGYQCSYTYKRQQIERQVKRLCGDRGVWKTKTVEQWIGFSLDEVGRMKPTVECRCGHNIGQHDNGACKRCEKCEGFDRWQVNRWPLIEMGMRRDDTIRWFAENGHPTPPRSACWFCPNSGNARWQELRETHPGLFEKAVTLDLRLRDGTIPTRGLRGERYLHQSCVPLNEADLRTARQIAADNGQQELFDVDAIGMDCSAGVCFT